MDNKDLTPEKMNEEVKTIWDQEISERLKRGELNSEMDIQGVFRAELEARGLIGKKNPSWGCYYHLPLLRPTRGYNPFFDFVLMQYEDGNFKRQYPAIVAEFKLWSSDTDKFKKDFERLKLLMLPKKEGYPLNHDAMGYVNRPYSCHLMYIIDLAWRKRVGIQASEKWARELEKLREPVGPYISDSGIKPKKFYNSKQQKGEQPTTEDVMRLKTDRSQWGRYGGDPIRSKMADWYPPEGGYPQKRELWQLRVTYTTSANKSLLAS